MIGMRRCRVTTIERSAGTRRVTRYWVLMVRSVRISPALAGEFFDNPWIDVPPREGKAGGAFAHPTVPSAHPYLLLNYHGRTRDVMTLAHELGHGVHQVLASDSGISDGQYAADTGGDGERIWRNADVPVVA